MNFAAQAVLSILLAGGVSFVAIVGLYLLRSRQRLLVVRTLAFYRQTRELSKRRVARSRLRRVYSLLLQLLILGCLLMALLRPQLEKSLSRRVIFAIDSSASMCREQNNKKHIYWATKLVKKLSESLDSDDQAMVVRVGSEIEPQGNFSSDISVLGQQLSDLGCDDSGRDLAGLIDWAWGSLYEHPQAELIFLTDLALNVEEKAKATSRGFNLVSEDGVKLSVIERRLSIPSNEPSLAVTSFSARSQPDDLKSLETLVEVTNFGEDSVEAQLAIYQIEQADVLKQVQPPYLQSRTLLELKTLQLSGLERRRILINNLSRSSSLLVVEVQAPGNESFLADNIAYFALAPRRERRVQVVGSMSTYLEAALLLDPLFQVTSASSVEQLPNECELRIYLAGSTASKQAHCAEVYLGADSAQAAYPVKLGSELNLVGFDEWDSQSKLFQFYDPYQVQILKAYSATPDPKQKILAASEQGGLLVSGTRGVFPWVAFTFIPEESDFVLRAAWPLFIHHLVTYLVPDGSLPELLGLQSGVAQLLPASLSASSRLLLKGPQVRVEVRSISNVPGSSVRVLLPKAGFYQVAGADRFPFIAASLFESKEAELTQVTGEGNLLAGMRTEKKGSFMRASIWLNLCLLGLILFVLESWCYHRRWTL